MNRVWIILGSVIAIVLVLVLLTMFYSGMMNMAQSAGTTTDMMLISEATAEDGGLECEGVHITVLYKPGQVKPGESLLNDCIVAVFNCGPGNANVDGDLITATVYDKDDYSDKLQDWSGAVDIGTLKKNDFELVSCTDIFGAEQKAFDEEDEHLEGFAKKIYVEVKMYPSGGKAVYERWEIDYVRGIKFGGS
jgi:hypothetical protein